MPADPDRALVRRLGADATVEQALNPGLKRWRSPTSLVAFARGRMWPGGPIARVTAGGPVCEPDRLGATVRAFEDHAAGVGESVLWFGVCEPFVGAILDYTSLVVGAQPVWAPRRWPSILAGKASLRAQLYRARNKGVSVQRWSREQAAASRTLCALLTDWLAHRGMPPLHHLAEPDVLGALGDREVFVAHRGGTPVAYLLFAPVPARQGWLVEWIIQGEAAPNGTATLLLDAAFRHAIDAEADVVSLGLVPLSSYAPPSASAPPRHVRALLVWVRAHTERFYGFRGLERFKAKFQPDSWEPIHLATRAPRVGLRHLHAVADAFAGPRSPEAMVARAVAGAAATEARTLRQWLSWRGTGRSPASIDRPAARAGGAARRGTG